MSKYKLLNIVNGYIESLGGQTLSTIQYNRLVDLLDVPTNSPFQAVPAAIQATIQYIYDHAAVLKIEYANFDYTRNCEDEYVSGLTRFAIEKSFHTLPVVNKVETPVSLEVSKEIARFIHINIAFALEETEGE